VGPPGPKRSGRQRPDIFPATIRLLGRGRPAGLLYVAYKKCRLRCLTCEPWERVGSKEAPHQTVRGFFKKRGVIT